MTEPDVAITDFLLAAQAAWFVLALRRSASPGWLRETATLMFGGLALAALTGGLWHGFLTEPSFLSRVIWWLIMMYIGTAAVAYALLGLGLLGWHSRPTLYGIATAAVAYAIYSALTPDFYPAVIVMLLATVIGIGGLARHVAKPGAWMAICGAVAIVLAAVPQQLQWGVPSLRLSHNAIYHLLLLGAHYLLYRGLRRLLAAEQLPPGSNPL